MLFTQSIATVAVAALSLCELSAAAPHFTAPKITYKDKRQANSSSTTTSSASNVANDNNSTLVINPNVTATPPQVLEPVIPPAVNPSDLSILSLAPSAGNVSNITLAWAGSTGTSNKNRRKRDQLLKRDGGLLSQANFAFNYPTVPLDHSTYVSGVSCPVNGSSMTGTLSGSAYTFAKQQWSNASDILFITAANGCGPDANNQYFHATSVTFNDATNTFAASGTSHKPLDVSSYMSLQWGELGTSSFKRSINKRDMFEPHPIHNKRFDVGGEIDLFNFHWGVWLEDIIGTDNDAPWDDAALIAEFSKGVGIEDGDFEEGEESEAGGHHKRSNETSLAIREDSYEEGVEFGLKLYCVHCGFGGSAKLYGNLEVGIHPLFFIEDESPITIDTVQVGFQASLDIGLNLGMEAYVEYTQKAEVDLINIPIPDASFTIFDIVECGPYIGLSMSIENVIKASGSLLLGVAVEWDDVDILLDILHPSNSHANGFTPQFVKTANASGELDMSSTLGFPVELGIEIKLDSDVIDWKADVGIVDQPSIILEGIFEVSADLEPDGSIDYDINDGCYGIAWDIHFENLLYLKAEADDIGEVDYNLIEPYESPPIASGCIGYVDDGSDDDDDSDDPTGTGSNSGLGGNGLNSGGNGLGGASGNAVGTSSAAKATPKVLLAAAATNSTASSTASASGTATTQTSSSAPATTSSSSKTSTSSAPSSISSSSTTLNQLAAAAVTSSSSTSALTSSSTSKATTTSSSSSSGSSFTSTKPITTSTSSSPSSSKPVTTSTSTSSSSKPATTSSSTSSTSSSSKPATTSSSISSTSSSTKPATFTSTSSSVVKAASTSSSSTTLITSTSKTSSSSTTLATSTSKTSTSSTTTSACSTSATPVSSLFPSTSTTTTSTSTHSTGTKTSSSTTSTASPTSTAITCKKLYPSAAVATSYYVGQAANFNTVDLCGQHCLQNTQCISFSYNVQSSCQMYNKMVGSTIVTTDSRDQNATFYDRQCYALSKC